MFCDLDKIDIVYTQADGATVGVQTDHRATDALAEDLPRTIVFTLARILRPMSSEHGLDHVECVFPAMPPERLREAIETAGARLRVEEALVEPLHAVDEAQADRIAAEALETVGRDALDRAGCARTAEGLEALERKLSPAAAEYEAWVPEQRFTAVLELGAAAGEVMRAEHGGRWVRDSHFQQALPFTVDRDGACTNLFGRATRFFEESTDEGPSLLLRTATEGPTDGPILPVLRAANYGAGTQGARTSRPLLEGLEDVEGVPHVYLVQDRPQSVQYLSPESLEDFDALLEASFQNLVRLPVRPKRLGDDVPIFLLDGDFFATSKLLDQGMLMGLAEALGAELLMVAAPNHQVGFVAPLSEDVGFTHAFVNLVRSTFEESPPRTRLSPLVFAAIPGVGVKGILQLEEEAGAPAPAISDAEPSGPASAPEPVDEVAAGSADEPETDDGEGEVGGASSTPWWKKLFGK